MNGLRIAQHLGRRAVRLPNGPGLSGHGLALVAALLGLLSLSVAAAPEAEVDKAEFSAANRLLFFTYHLQGLEDGTVLYYDFERAQPEAERFSDQIALRLSVPEQGDGLNVQFQYFTGERERYAPQVAHARGNPILLLFLQRDAYEMAMRSGGSVRHFQNLIKKALQDGAEVRPVQFEFNGRRVDGTRIRIVPYVDDKYKDNYRPLAQKAYEFTLAEAVPGGIYELKTTVPISAEPGAEPTPQTWEQVRFDHVETGR